MKKSPVISLGQKLLVVMMAIGLALSGCGITPPPQSRNQLAIGVLSDPKTFNPALNNEAVNIFTYTTEGMVTENGQGETVPALAESWQISGNSITFKLRPNLQWSDGAPLTVDDVLFSFNEVYLNDDIPTDTRDVLRIGQAQKLPTVEKVSEREVKITTPEPFAPALRTIGGIGILPAHKLRQAVRTKDQEKKSKFLSTWGTDTPPRELVSNGMYQLENYVVGERLVFKRNPHYWRKDSQGQQLPYIDRLIWQIVEGGDSALMQFRSKNTDVYSVAPFFFSLLKGEEKKGDFTIRNLGPNTGTSFLAFNLNKGSRQGVPLVDPVKSKWFNAVQFRQAVAYALDRPRMINNIYQGLGATQDSPISVGTPYYRAPQPTEIYNYDPAKAKQLLQSINFKYRNNQLFDSKGNRVRFTLNVPAESKTYVALGTQIKQDLSNIGIDVNFAPIAFSTLLDKLDNSLDWDAHIIGFSGGVEPNEGANFWLAEGRSHVFNQKPNPQQEPLTGQEVAPWEKEINDLYIQGAQELNPSRRQEIYYKTQQITQANLPCIYLVNPLYLLAIRNRLQGVQPSTIGGALWNLYELKIKE